MATIVNLIQALILLALAAGAFMLQLAALRDWLGRKPQEFTSAGKLTKPIWGAILIVASLIGFLALTSMLGPAAAALGFSFPVGQVTSPLGFLSIVGAVAAAVYILDVKPALSNMGGGYGGGYGGW